MNWQRLTNRSALITIIFIAIFVLVLFATPQQTSSSPEFVADDSYLQDDAAANADRGLFTAVTPTTTSRNPDDTLARSRLVTLNENANRALSTGPDYETQQVLHLNLFEDVMLTAVLDRIETNKSGSYTWFGHVADVEFSDVILVINGSLITGHITTPTATYNITPIEGNLHRIAQLNSGAILSGEDDSRIPPKSDAEDTIILAPEASDDGSRIDVMVLYTDDAKAAHTQATLQNWIELFMAFTNQAYINSNLNQRAALVHTAEIAYNEPGDNDTALDDLTNKGDGIMEDAHTWRDTYHADLVLLLVNNDGSGGNSCSGLAWVQTNVTPSFENNGFGVMKACSFGAGIFAHELGHTMGGQHDWFVSTATDPYPYAHGFVDTTNRIRTIMSYDNRCDNLGFDCAGITYFSNPSINYQGNPIGIPGVTPTNCTGGNQPGAECVADIRTTFDNTDSNTAVFRSSQNTWIGTNTNWHDANNWSMNEGPPSGTTPISRVPRAIDNVFIPETPTGGNFPVINANADVRDVTIANNARLTMTGGTLNVYGNWEDQGVGAFYGNGGTIVLKGTVPQTITNYTTFMRGNSGQPPSYFNNVQIGDGGSTVVNPASNININGNLTIQTGATLDAGNNTIRLYGNWSENWPSGFNEGTSTIIFDGANQTVNKVTTTALFNEQFTDADNAGCGCSTTLLPSGWTYDGSWFGGEIGGENGAALRWDSSADAWLFTTAVNLSAGVQYQVSYKYREDSAADTDTVTLYVGSSQASGSMTTQISTATSTTATYTTKMDTFTVPTSGTYYIGIRGQQVSGAGILMFDDLSLSGTKNPTFYNLVVNNSGSLTFNQDVAIQSNLTVHNAAVMDILTNEATVEGTVTNNGTLQQTRDITDGSGGTNYDFLILQNLAQNATKYYGVRVTPDSGQPLDNTTVQVKGNQNCTSNTNDPLAQRCYDITPTSAQSATIKYWLTNGELNGQAQNALKVWDYNNNAWVQVGDAVSYGAGCGADDTCWVQWTGINTFSPMTVGSGAVPTGTPGGGPVCNAPDAATNLAAVRSGNNVNLSWTAGAGAESYDVIRKANDPYFTTGGTVIANVAGTSYSDTDTPLGNPAMNYTYMVVAKKGCGATAASSNRTGVFNFGITPGDGGGPTLPTVENGDFEAGAKGWQQFSSNAYDLIVNSLGNSVTPNSGTWAAWLGGADSEVSQLSQTFSIPNGIPVYLTYYYQLHSTDSCGYDFARVKVDGANVTEDSMCTTNNVTTWTKASIDMSPYAGQSVIVEFEATTDGSVVSSYYIDDVSFASSP